MVVTRTERSWDDDETVACIDLHDGSRVFNATVRAGVDKRIIISSEPPGIVVHENDGVRTWAPHGVDRDALERENPITETSAQEMIFHFRNDRPKKVLNGRLSISVTTNGQFAIDDLTSGHAVSLIHSKMGLVPHAGQTHGTSIRQISASLSTTKCVS